jgi:hypothetical protein
VRFDAGGRIGRHLSSVKLIGGGVVRPEEHIFALLLRPRDNGVGGRYSPGGWTVELGRDADPQVRLMASYHEANHAALNSSTAWGAVLEACAFVQRHTQALASPAVLASLVQACRQTHEAFATHTSVIDLGGRTRTPPDVLLHHYPDYLGYLDLALAVGPDAPVWSRWRRLAADAALIACMQSTALHQLLDVGIRNFLLSSIRLRDQPDERLKALRRVAREVWTAFDELIGERSPQGWAHVRAQEVGTTEEGPSSTWSWTDFSRRCLDLATLALRSLGYPTMTVAEVQALLPELVTQMKSLVPDEPVVLDTDSKLGAFSLFELERLQLHERRPSRLYAWSGGTSASKVLSGTRPRRHVFVTVRRPARLAAQFLLDEQDASALTDNAPVVAVQTRRAQPSSVPDVRLDRLEKPEQLSELPIDQTDLGVLVSISLSCLLDEEWRARWLPALQRAGKLTALLDLPFSQSVDALLDAGHSFGYTLASVPVAGQTYFVLCCRLATEPPLLTPCTPATGQALVNYIHHASGRRLVPDLSALGHNHEVITAIVEHLVQDESIIGLPS